MMLRMMLIRQLLPLHHRLPVLQVMDMTLLIRNTTVITSS
jgi:hypothetical protein